MSTQFPETFDPATQEGNAWDVLPVGEYVAQIVEAWWIDILKGLDFLRRGIGMSVVLLAHSAIETINDPRAASYTSYQLRLHKRARGLVQD